MDTRSSILHLADHLVKDKGFNAFSFHDISKTIGIKTASVHYHFPTKTDLGVALVQDHIDRLERHIKRSAHLEPKARLESFFSVYIKLKAEDKVCLVGSLATDLHSVDGAIKQELQKLGAIVLAWVTEILKEGRRKAIFAFAGAPRTKALMIITNMLGIVQLSRLTKSADVAAVKRAILKELKP